MPITSHNKREKMPGWPAIGPAARLGRYHKSLTTAFHPIPFPSKWEMGHRAKPPPKGRRLISSTVRFYPIWDGGMENGMEENGYHFSLYFRLNPLLRYLTPATGEQSLSLRLFAAGNSVEKP
jgi:hypothetical protein